MAEKKLKWREHRKKEAELHDQHRADFKWKVGDPVLMKRMFELLSQVPRPSDVKIAEQLQKEGFQIHYNTVRKYRRGEGTLGFVYDPKSIKKADKMILDSIEKVAEEFQDIFEKTKAKMEEWYNDDERSHELLKALKLLTEQLTVAIKKLGYMHDSIVEKQVNITQNFNEFNLFIKDLGAEINEKGEVVIKNPKP